MKVDFRSRAIEELRADFERKMIEHFGRDTLITNIEQAEVTAFIRQWSLEVIGVDITRSKND